MSDQIKGNLQQIKGKLKSKWADLTVNDDVIEKLIAKTGGGADILAGLLRERYGMLKDQATNEANDFLKSIQSECGNGECSDIIPPKIKETFDNAVESIKNNLNVEGLKSNVNDATEACVDYIKKKPVASMAMAFVAGILLAMVGRK